MKLPRPIIQAFKKAGIPAFDEYGYLTQSKYFYIRVVGATEQQKSGLQPGEQRWTIQFADKRTFDRWANSTNFETEIWYNPKKNQRFACGKFKGKRKSQYTIPNLRKELNWCKKVADSGLFEFNTYFSAIQTPWFIH